MNDKKPSPKSKVEAILFSIGHRISLDEISKLARVLKQDAHSALKELQKEYDEKQSSLMLVDEGEHWKFAVRDHLISVVRKIVTETELTKSVMETLAVIAFKYPILQSDLIHIRTNKAYDHLLELEKSGYITRQKHGRTNLIKLTEKFFRYFDLTEEALRDKFKDFASIAQAIKDKEIEVDKIKEDQKKAAVELGKQDEKIKKEIEDLDKAEEEYNIPVETYSVDKETKAKDKLKEQIQEKPKTLEGMEIVDAEPDIEKKEKKTKEQTPAKETNSVAETTREENIQPEDSSKKELTNNDIAQDQNPAPNKKPRHSKHHKGINLTPEQEKIAEQKANDMMGGK